MRAQVLSGKWWTAAIVNGHRDKQRCQSGRAEPDALNGLWVRQYLEPVSHHAVVGVATHPRLSLNRRCNVFACERVHGRVGLGTGDGGAGDKSLTAHNGPCGAFNCEQAEHMTAAWAHIRPAAPPLAFPDHPRTRPASLYDFVAITRSLTGSTVSVTPTAEEVSYIMHICLLRVC